MAVHGRRTIARQPAPPEDFDENALPRPSLADEVAELQGLVPSRQRFVAEEEEEEDDIERVIAEAVTAGGAKVILQRRERTGEYAYLDTIPPNLFTMESLKATYGPGQYRGKIIGERGRIVRHIPAFTIAAVALPVAAPVAAPENGTARVLEKLMDRLERLEQRPAVVTPPQGSPFETAKEMLTLFTGLMAVMKPNVNPMGEVKELAAAFREGMTLGQEISGGGKDENEGGFAKMVETVAPLVTAAAQRLSPGAAPVPVNPTAGRPGGDVPALTSGAPPITSTPVSPPAWLVRLKPYIPVVIQMARVPVRAESVADTLASALEQMGEADMNETLGALETSAAVDTIIQFVPQLEPHRSWLEEVRVATLTVFTEDGPEDAGKPSEDAAVSN